ncbi:hypothetical protein HOD75_00175 [archaeon]|jgi:pyruvate kinase|nr:hypothetical protein [Candidatus Woesearchaeota archaeon]MBT4136068.1 hypothetical protein [archaeon]MBT4241293.1 hypothetical protein [archaeon]MBT4418115.1 hypothetical protein [archaeon]
MVKIIATIHPSMRRGILKKLVKAGVDIFRINIKYTPFSVCKRICKDLRKIGGCEILIDIKKRSVLKKLEGVDYDYLAVSFAEKGSEIVKIRDRISKKVKIVSKIESKKGVRNVDELIKVSNGIMIARGDLGREINIEKIPFIQKMITKKCNKRKRFSITATEMMPSMVSYKRPSRAEVSDVANAILEGSEGLLLAEETAIGKYPVLVVKTMRKIIREVKSYERR